MRTIRVVLAWSFGILAALACSVTLLSMVRSNQWWIRVLDFPRLLELLAIGFTALGCLLFLRRWRWPVLAALALAAVWQAWRLWPYMPVAPAETALARHDADPRSCFTVLGLNVLQSNRDYAATIAMIERERPDVLLLMETDVRWATALAPVLSRYPHRLLRPIDNTYGMIFATRLPVKEARMVAIFDRDTPTLYAQLETRAGRAFAYVGLHPRPPRPDQDTAVRDAKIERAALAIAHSPLPAVAMGDFNDVAWSHTTQLFKRVGGFMDPRAGRGSFATFPAGHVALGWPLDQLFVTPEFAVRRLDVLENVGSDHRPLAAALCLMGTGADATGTSKAARVNAREAVRSAR